MIRLLTLIACCHSVAVFAQFVTPFDPNGNFRNWAIKGKALPFVLGDAAGISALFGAEYGFAKNQSIGVDGFVESISKTDDNGIDTAGVIHSVSPYYHSREKALFLNYRYYFNCKKLRAQRGIIPYALAFFRYGKIHQHYDPLYPLTSFLTNDETHYSGGLMAGSIFQFTHTGRLGVDVNTGIFIKQKDISTVYQKDNQPYTIRSKPSGPGYRLSVNLEYWFVSAKSFH